MAYGNLAFTLCTARSLKVSQMYCWKKTLNHNIWTPTDINISFLLHCHFVPFSILLFRAFIIPPCLWQSYSNSWVQQQPGSNHGYRVIHTRTLRVVTYTGNKYRQFWGIYSCANWSNLCGSNLRMLMLKYVFPGTHIVCTSSRAHTADSIERFYVKEMFAISKEK